MYVITFLLMFFNVEYYQHFKVLNWGRGSENYYVCYGKVNVDNSEFLIVRVSKNLNHWTSNSYMCHISLVTLKACPGCCCVCGCATRWHHIWEVATDARCLCLVFVRSPHNNGWRIQNHTCTDQQLIGLYKTKLSSSN